MNEFKLSPLFVIRKNEDCPEVKEMSEANDSHLALFINGKYCNQLHKCNFFKYFIKKLFFFRKLPCVL